jgi:hypothetical protein
MRWDGSAFLERTNLPILEIWGDHGLETPSLDKLRIPEKETIEVVWIENASHQLSLEAPERLAEAANSFIRRVESQSRLAFGCADDQHQETLITPSGTSAPTDAGCRQVFS